MAAQNNSENNRFATWLDVFQNKLPKVSDEVKKIFEKIQKNISEGFALTNYDAFIESNKLADKSLIAFLKDAEYGKKDLASYQQYLKDTGKSTSFFTSFIQKASTTLKSLGSAMKSMAIDWAIGKIIGFVANAFDNYIHRVEKARERTAELFDEFNEMNKTLADHKKTVAELADKYDELSKGVNLSTNENNTLSTKEYKEFLEINEQLADTFPELTKGVDKNGRSILKLGTNGITAKEQLEELLKAEEDLNNFRIAQDLKETFKGVATYVEDANKATEKLNGDIKDYNETISKLKGIHNGVDVSGDLIFTGNVNDEAELTYMNTLKNSAKEFLMSLDDDRYIDLKFNLGIDDESLFILDHDQYTGAFKVYSKACELTEEERKALEKIIDDNFYSVTGALSDSIGKQEHELQRLVQEGESAWSDFIPTLVAGMKGNPAFKDLQDPDLQHIAVKIVESLDSSYEAAMKKYNPDPYVYIRDKLLVPMSMLDEADKKKVKDAFAELMTLDANDISDKNIKQINDLTKEITDILGEDFDIKVALGFDGDDVKTRLENSLHQITGDFHEGAELTRFTKEFTKEQAELWLEINRGTKGAKYAIYNFNKALEDAKKAAKSTPLSISETVEQIDTRLRSTFSSLQSAYQEIFTLDEDTKEKIFTPLSEAEITDKFRPILDALHELDEINGIHVDYSIYNDFVSVLSDTSSTADDAQKQFNRLASYIIYTSGCTNMSAETFDLLAKSLNEMGVTNAYEILEKIRDAQEGLAKLGYDVTTITQDEAASIIKLGVASIETEEYLRRYLIQKELAQNPLSTTDDIAQLEELCNALGITGEMYQAVNTLKAAMAEKQRGAYDYDIDNTIEYYQKRIKDLASGYGYDFSFNFDGANSKSSSSSKDTHKQKYEKELQELEHAHDMGLISDAEYWKARIDLNERYFGESSGMHQKYLDEYRDAEEAILGGIKNLWKDYYDQRKSELKDLISYAQELYDKEIDSLDASIEKLEERRDTEKMYWQNQIDDLDDEIDALQDANDEKQRAIDLQNKQYQLQKAMHQRTMLIYSESKGLHYVTDDKAVRDAKNDLDDAENDNKIEGLKKQQKDLQKQLDTILETYDSQIESIEKQIDSLNKVKSAWSEIVNNQELKELEERLKSIFGDDVKEKILSDNTDFITGIISQYSDTSEILKTIEDATLTDIQNMVSQYGVLPENLMYALNEGIPNVTSNIDEIAKTAINAASEVSSITEAINNIPESKDVTISIHTVYDDSGTMASRVLQAANLGNAYASGTKRAQKGIAVVGEEKPEVVITNNKKVLLAEHPTLLNMEGGETVFDGDETEKMLKARGLRRITPDELPLLKALTQYNSSEITQRFTPNITSPANAILSSTMQNASHAVTNNSSIQPSYTMGDVHIHCPGITKDEVVKQIGTELTNVFSGISLKAYQRANITR